VVAVEIMLNPLHISELILKADISGAKKAFKNTTEPGMQCFDVVLLELYTRVTASTWKNH
jgi:Tfp pilus assembly ATPase PilU